MVLDMNNKNFVFSLISRHRQERYKKKLLILNEHNEENLMYLQC